MERKVGKLFFEEFGSKNKTPVIFIHGWGSDHNSLVKASLKYFEKDYRCIFIDLLGYGKSEKYDKKSSIYICQQNADAIIELIKELKLKNVILYGNCLGGWVATEVVLKNTELINKLIFIDGYLYFDKEYKYFVYPVIRYPFYRFFFQSKVGLHISNFFVGFSTKITDEFLTNQKNTNPHVALDYIKDLYKIEREGGRERVKNIYTPSLYIIGKHTLPVIKRSLEYWKNNVKNSECGYIEKSSHLTVTENPEDLNLKILSYLRKK